MVGGGGVGKEKNVGEVNKRICEIMGGYKMNLGVEGWRGDGRGGRCCSCNFAGLSFLRGGGRNLMSFCIEGGE